MTDAEVTAANELKATRGRVIIETWPESCARWKKELIYGSADKYRTDQFRYWMRQTGVTTKAEAERLAKLATQAQFYPGSVGSQTKQPEDVFVPAAEPVAASVATPASLKPTAEDRAYFRSLNVKVDQKRDLEWAYANIDDEDVVPRDAPSLTAWSQLTWARSNRDAFFTQTQRQVKPQGEKPEGDDSPEAKADRRKQ